MRNLLGAAIAAAGCLALGAAQAPGQVQAESQEAPAAAGPGVVSGTLQLDISLLASANLPAGTVITLNPTASIYDARYNNYSYVYTSAKVTAGKVQATIKIPYKWLVTSTKDNINISLNAYGSDATGETYNQTFLNKVIAVPANGKTTVIRFSAAI